MAGVIAYGAYLPYFRLQRSTISAALGTPMAGGARAVAAYDEDTTSMGVEAGRLALRSLGDAGPQLAQVLFATADPAYLDKTNATAVHAALDLGGGVPAYDMVGSVRSGIGALLAGVRSAEPSLVVLSDIRTGLPGGGDEAAGGDGAVAFMTGEGPVIAELVASAGSTAEFLDRWRLPGEVSSHRWEERFGETVYVPLAESAVTDAFKQAGVTAEDVDHLIVTGVHARACRRVAGSVGARSEAIVDDRTSVIGNCGTAHAGLLLADVLDRADPGQVIAVVVLADGVDVLLLRTTDALDAYRQGRAPTVARQIAEGNDSLPYATFLTWRGMLRREPPRRPDPERPAAPPAFRREPWKYAFTGSRCEACGTRHLPPQRVCVKCGAVDRMAPERLADVPATVATFTVDRLAFSLSPPVVAAVIDFDGGGRFQCELTDVDPAAVAIGDRVEMTFRRLFTAQGVHNYFWKARPVRGEPREER